MSYADGMAAINLEMPARIPRTEYSADSHWQLVSAVTGLAVSQTSPDDVKILARKAFMKAWSYDLCWSILISRQEFGDQRTRMGHAVYAAEGADYDDRISVLFDDPEAALSFDPKALYPSQDQAALVRRFNDHYAANCAFYPDAVNMTGIYITCMSGLIDIFGWNTLLTAAGIDSDAFGQMTNRYADWILPYFEALALSDAPVVMVHDDIVLTSGAFIHPQWYRRFIFPNYRRFMRPLLDCGKKVLFTSDGTYTELITDLADCGFPGFVSSRRPTWLCWLKSTVRRMFWSATQTRAFCSRATGRPSVPRLPAASISGGAAPVFFWLSATTSRPIPRLKTPSGTRRPTRSFAIADPRCSVRSRSIYLLLLIKYLLTFDK